MAEHLVMIGNGDSITSVLVRECEEVQICFGINLVNVVQLRLFIRL